eukprot:CAMPEP_0198285366 /NCGR_PEP_ID=MMETSP1449-20131203/4677_1 /TAXON_ID=420275 /ORGANISM="Attheya septentrionalis, Strain CCMP2084" /LENGTH=564 /DNA_ID=CAMNT_0043982771 /DNA_START=292 /DNA_END=1986 /DNA_ORIENTATION=-
MTITVLLGLLVGSQSLVVPNRKHGRIQQKSSSFLFMGSKVNGNWLDNILSPKSVNDMEEGDMTDFSIAGNTPVASKYGRGVLEEVEGEEPRASAWGLVKDVVYGSLDQMKGVTEPEQNSAARLEVGYSDTVTPLLTPGAQLLSQYENVRRDQLPTSRDSIDDIVEEDMFRSPARKAFDGTKDVLYSFADTLSSATKNNPEEKKLPKRIVNEYSENDFLLDDSLKEEMQRLVVEATDPKNNEWKKFQARRKFKTMERRESQRKAQAQISQTIDTIKGAAYTVADITKGAVDTVTGIPEVTAQTAKNTRKSLDMTARTVRDIPYNIRQTVKQTKDNLEETKRVTKVVVQDVKSIPNVVKTKAIETQEEIAATKRKFQEAMENLEDMIFQFKVWAGLEEPKPIVIAPTPLPTPQELAIQVAKTVAAGFGQAAWFISKSLVGLGFAGLKSAFEQFTKPAVKNDADSISSVIPTKPIEERGVRQNTPIAEITSVADVDVALDKEVSDALRLAEEALSVSMDSISKIERGQVAFERDEQVTDALERAREAARAATRDARALEEILNQRKK